MGRKKKQGKKEKRRRGRVRRGDGLVLVGAASDPSWIEAREEGTRCRGHRAPDRCEEGRPRRKKSARRRGRGGAALLWIEQGGGGARWIGWAMGSREIE